MNFKPPLAIPADAKCHVCGMDFRINNNAYLITEIGEDGKEKGDKLTWVHQKCTKNKMQ